MTTPSILMIALGLALAGGALAHTGATHPSAGAKAISAEEHAFGREGDPNKATRTVKVDMSDRMRFSPSALTVKRGETVLSK